MNLLPDKGKGCHRRLTIADYNVNANADQVLKC
ncbi:hypothetical protein DIKCMJMK_00039 [Shewanella oneidensis]|nr:hypothetical protein [Shewanella oneidensis]